MKKYLIFLSLMIVILGISCKRKNQATIGESNHNPNDTSREVKVIFDKSIVDANICGSGFTVYPKTKYTSLLKNYLYSNLIDKSPCKTIGSKTLFKTDIFKKTIIFIYTDKFFLESGIYEDEYMWQEEYISLLVNISDSDIRKEIVNDLLGENISDGLIVFFDEDITQFSNFNFFLEKNKSDFYEMIFLYAIAHNIKNVDLKNSLRKVILSCNNYDDEIFSRLNFGLSSKGNIQYAEFLELAYGGV